MWNMQENTQKKDRKFHRKEGHLCDETGKPLKKHIEQCNSANTKI